MSFSSVNNTTTISGTFICNEVLNSTVVVNNGFKFYKTNLTMGFDMMANLGFYISGLKDGKHLHLNSGKGDLLGDIYLNDGSPNSNVYFTGNFIGANNLYTIYRN